jgi:hypothetical protein
VSAQPGVTAGNDVGKIVYHHLTIVKNCGCGPDNRILSEGQVVFCLELLCNDIERVTGMNRIDIARRIAFVPDFISLFQNTGKIISTFPGQLFRRRSCEAYSLIVEARYVIPDY